MTYDSENDASKVLSLKEEDLIFKENKLNIGHAFRKKNNFDNANQYQQNPRANNGMAGGGGGGAGLGGGQHHMMGGNNNNLGHLGLGGHGGIGVHNGSGMSGGGLNNMGGLGGLGGAGHPGNNSYLDNPMNGGASGMHPMNTMNGFSNSSQGMTHNAMGYGMNGHLAGMSAGMGGMGGLTGMNGMNMN